MSVESNKFKLNLLIIFCQRFELLTIIKSDFLDFLASLTFDLFLSLLEQDFKYFAALIFDKKHPSISSAIISDCQNILIFCNTITIIRLL